MPSTWWWGRGGDDLSCHTGVTERQANKRLTYSTLSADSRIETQVLCKSSKCAYPLSHLDIPGLTPFITFSPLFTALSPLHPLKLQPQGPHPTLNALGLPFNIQPHAHCHFPEMERCRCVDVSSLLGESDLILFFISTVEVWL